MASGELRYGRLDLATVLPEGLRRSARLVAALAKARPEANVLSLVADPGLEREPHPLRHVGLVEELLVGVKAPLVWLELRLCQRGRVRAQEQLQQARIPELVQIGVRVGSPLSQRSLPCRRKAIHAAPAAAFLPALVQQAGVRQARALRVQLGVRN